MTRKRVAFVGSFKKSAGDNTIGGVAAACKLLVGSRITDSVRWQLVDNTMRRHPPPGVVVRGWDAFLRVLQLSRHLVDRDLHGVLVFTPYAPTSLLEKGTMVLLARARGKRVVLSLRSEVRRSSDDRWLFWFKRRALQACDVVLCQGAEPADKVLELFDLPPERVRVIPNWIDLELFADVRRRRRERVRGPVTTFLFFGWLETFKGVPELLEACGQLAAQGHDFRMVLCGGGPLAEELPARCRELGIEKKVDARGWVSGQDKLDAFAESDVLVLPSHSEGMPNAVLEAMAAAMPVVATKVGAIPSLVEHGVSGLLIDKGDVPALVEAMGALLHDADRAQAMGDEAEARARAHHDINVLAGRVAEALDVNLPEPGDNPQAGPVDATDLDERGVRG